MPDLSLEACVEHLADVFGHRFVDTRRQGWDALAGQLRKQFKLSADQADSLLREMEQSRAIRYVEPGESHVVARDNDRYRSPTHGPASPIDQDLPGGVPFYPSAEAMTGEPGYWEIGEP